jgi:DNA-binding response OmpR family regulator
VRVLAVDDDVDARAAIHRVVTSLGHACLVTTAGPDALLALQEQEFDVVVAGVVAGPDALRQCEAIRALTSASGYVCLVVLTAPGDDDASVRMLAAAADHCLRKPLLPDDLALVLIAAERVTAVHRDLRRLREDLRRAVVREAELNEQLRRAERLRSDQLAMVGHDARQPLSAVIGFLETTLEVWDTTADDVKRDHIGRALSAAGRLDRLIKPVTASADPPSRR